MHGALSLCQDRKLTGQLPPSLLACFLRPSISQATLQRFQKVLKLWPSDPLRPKLLLRDVLDQRVAKGVFTPRTPESLTQAAREAIDEAQVTALEALAENRFQNKVRRADMSRP